MLLTLVPPSFPNQVGNKLLAALPNSEYERLFPKLQPVSLPFTQRVYEQNEPIEYLYFINRGVVSMLNIMEDGGAIEVATVGNEGFIGVPLLLGAEHSPLEAFVQIPGDALRIKADVFKREITPGSPSYNLLLRYTQALIDQLGQSAACNRLHSIEERCCRWLLLTQDRVGSDEFPLTHEFLAQMLGVRRASVSIIAAVLQKAGLISYHRGKMMIVDRKGLEAGACECYQVIKAGYDRLLG